jgi:hypothetical protein
VVGRTTSQKEAKDEGWEKESQRRRAAEAMAAEDMGSGHGLSISQLILVTGCTCGPPTAQQINR